MKKAFLSLATLSLISLLEAVITIDFEGMTGGNHLAGSAIPLTARIRDQFLSSHGVQFSSTPGYVGLVDLGAGHAYSGVNGISGATASGNVTYTRADPIEVRFFMPGGGGAGMTDLVAFRMDRDATSGELMTLQAFDFSGNLVDTDVVPDSSGGTLLVTTSLSLIHRVRFLGTTSNSSGVALDDLQFNPISPVPEPVTVVVISGGLLGVLRRRNSGI